MLKRMGIWMCNRTDWQCTGPDFTDRQGLTRSCPRPLPARSRIPMRCESLKCRGITMAELLSPDSAVSHTSELPA